MSLPTPGQTGPAEPGGMAASVRRILPLAWPVLIGQLAVLAFSTVDTLMVGRTPPQNLAALAVGSAAYITVFVGFMGVILAVGPIAGRHFGAREPGKAGEALSQSLWLALGLSVLGCALMLWPDPFLKLAKVNPEVEALVRGYLTALAVALPPALLFTSYRGFNNAISRPKAVMAMQLLGLAFKVPLNALLVFGWQGQGPWGELRIPAMGAVGCGWATAIVMWLQWAVAWAHLRKSPHYVPFGIPSSVFGKPHPAGLVEQLRLGIPMGGAILIEITGFTFMAFFIARLGITPVAGHQIAVNLIAVMFMLPLAWGNACSTLVAQEIGARNLKGATRLGWHGLQTGLAMALGLGVIVVAMRPAILQLYTHDAQVLAAAMPLLAWVAIFHAADATQTIAAYVLRAWQVTTVPLLIYAAAIWGVGLGGGYALAFGLWEGVPEELRGAPGFWAAATAGLSLASLGLCAYLGVMARLRLRETRGTCS